MDNRKIWSQKKKNVHYIDEEFFTNWSPNMAYILGFFAADGCLTVNHKRNNRYIEFVSTDRDIIKSIKKCLRSDHKITSRKRNINWSVSYRLQVGSKKIFNDLVNLGFTPNKSKVLKFPTIPSKYLSHFIRGYFDGDGHCSFIRYKKKDRLKESDTITSGFTSGSRHFLSKLQIKLKKYAKTKGGALSFHNRAFRLIYSLNDSRKLYNFLYKEIDQSLYLSRKYIKFNQVLKNMGW